MERYRSGHTGTDSKSVGGTTPHAGSNPALSASFLDLEIMRLISGSLRFRGCHSTTETQFLKETEFLLSSLPK
jgi:hypothetical protein